MKSLSFFLLAFLFAGCSTIPTVVKSVHEFTPDAAPRGRVLILGSSAATQGAEEDRYADLIATELARHGLVRTTDAQQADYVLKFAYGIGGSHTDLAGTGGSDSYGVSKYQHILSAELTRNAPGSPVIWRGNASALSDHQNLEETVPLMLHDMFNVFPGKSGEARQYMH